MESVKNVDLLPLQSRLRYGRDRKGLLQVRDPVRKKFIRATPEEMVRQMWIAYFLDVMNVNVKLISVERLFNIHGMPRRFDLVIFDKSTHPVLLAEFKGPGIKIQQAAFDQIGHYNMQLHVPYTLISNGNQHYCFQIDDEKKGFIWLNELPSVANLEKG